VSVVCSNSYLSFGNVIFVILRFARVIHYSATKLPILELRGYELTEDYLIENGFRRPILVRCKDGLDLQVPHQQFSVEDVEHYVGESSLRHSLWTVFIIY